MRTLTLLCALPLFAVSTVTARDDLPPETYRAATIPPDLKTEATAVIRFEAVTFRVLNVRDAVQQVRRVITILNAEGREFGEVSLGYDMFRKIERLDGTLYNADGDEIRSLDDRDIKDYSAAAGLYDDNRVRTAALYHNAYPYTVELEYELNYRGFISWPTWYPEEEKASVEFSRFEVELPREMKLRYWGSFGREPSLTTDRGRVTYQWNVASLPPFEPEPLGPPLADQYTSVHVAPGLFEIDGYAGNMTSWRSFGYWYFQLQEGRQDLPEKARLEVAALTVGVTDRMEKIRRLYEHLQSKTRYVSVQLGIGGWQPFNASYVYERGYGDCKALTNYMVAMLRASGIDAYPALIYSGGIPIHLDPEFPYNQFNHVILFAPSANDTVWLECTSQTIPFGHISRYNENRFALVVKPDGGTLVRTPTSRASDNVQVRTARVVLDSKGHGVAEITTRYTGDQQDFIRMSLADASPLEREKWLRNAIEIPTYELQSAAYPDLSAKERAVGLAFKLQLPRYASMTGTRLLFHPNLMEKRTYIPKKLEKRQFPIVHSYPYLDIDTVIYKLPEGYGIEALPKPVSIETPFGTYTASTSSTESGSLMYTRKLEFRTTEIPANAYESYRSFLMSVVQADKALAALVKK
jgi:transglutaminase-like putative cysteine protease